MKLATIENVKEGMYFDLADDARKIYAYQVMECWATCMTVKAGAGCISKPYGDFRIVEDPESRKHKYPSEYFEDHRPKQLTP